MTTEGGGPVERPSGTVRRYIRAGGGGGADDPPRPRYLRLGQPYDPRPLREKTRSRLAQILVWLLVVASLTLIGATAAGWLTLDEAKTLAGVVFSPLIAVTGTALGFYFGGRSAGDSGD